LTRNKAGSVRVLFTLIATFGVAMLAALLPLNLKLRYLRFLALVGFAVAAGGVASRIWIPQGDNLWWIYPVPHGLPGPLAGFTNPNHFGAFLALLCPAVLCLIVEDFGGHRWFSCLVDAAVFAAMSVAIALSLSRGAFTAYVTGILTVAAGLLYRKRLLAVLSLGIFASAVILALLAGLGPTVKERLHSLRNVTQTLSYRTRLDTWQDSLRIFRAYPVIGAGANAFRMVYPQHRLTSRSAVMTHPENEYIQLLTDNGLVGVALVLLLCASIARASLHSALGTKSDPLIGIAVLAAAAAAGVNAMLDFPLHIPVYAITLASLVGLILPFPCHGTRRLRLKDGRRLPLPSVATVNLVCVLVSVPLWGQYQRLDAPGRMRNAETPAFARALRWAPTSPSAWRYLGWKAKRSIGGVKGAAFRETCLTTAAHYDPNNYRVWLKLGEARLALGDRAGARQAFARVNELRDWVQTPHIPRE
jgi:O-antigen ligase